MLSRNFNYGFSPEIVILWAGGSRNQIDVWIPNHFVAVLQSNNGGNILSGIHLLGQLADRPVAYLKIVLIFKMKFFALYLIFLTYGLRTKILILIPSHLLIINPSNLISLKVNYLHR